MLKYGHIVPLYAPNLKEINRFNLNESRVYSNNKPEAVCKWVHLVQKVFK